MSAVDRLLAEHVSLRITSIDRIGVAGYIRALCFEGGVVKFLLHRAAMLNRDTRIPSPALLGHNHDRLLKEMNSFVAEADLPVVRFANGDCKEDLARPYQDAAAAAGRPGVVLVGKAQEKMKAWVGYKDKASPLGTEAHPHFSFSRQSKVPDHWYFYLWDPQWGPALVKLAPYAPYPLWIVCNGHQWLKRQLDLAGVAYAALDNGLRSVDDPALARRLAANLSAGHLRSAIDRWLSWLPSPLVGADRRARFAYEFSIRQLENLRHRGVRRSPPGPGLVRGRHPRPRGPGPPRTGGSRGRSPRPLSGKEPHTRALRHRDRLRRRQPQDPDPLQVLQGQGLLQGGPGAQGGDHHQQRR